LDGVTNATSGYAGGDNQHAPSYEEVCANATGHAEAVLVEYDPAKLSYQRLLEVFWNNHNPTTPNRQGPNVGTQYRSVIFFHDEEQKSQARQSMTALESSGRYAQPIVTELVPATKFWEAEDHHQNYYGRRGIVPACSL
jgi:peptide-methionine (S)-S-oxide reductase